MKNLFIVQTVFFCSYFTYVDFSIFFAKLQKVCWTTSLEFEKKALLEYNFSKKGRYIISTNGNRRKTYAHNDHL